MTTFRKKGAFTLVEIIAVVVLLGTLGLIAGMYLPGLFSAANDKLAISKAQSINQAQLTYQLRISGSNTAWASASTNDAKFTLVQPYLPNNPSSISAYAPTGYTFTLGSTLNTYVAITNATGQSVTY